MNIKTGLPTIRTQDTVRKPGHQQLHRDVVDDEFQHFKISASDLKIWMKDFPAPAIGT
jgi:hypothetical protein